MLLLLYFSVIIFTSFVHTHAAYHSKTTCEGEYFSIACQPNQSLLIEDAFYGGARCGRRSRIHCRSKSAKTVTSKLCDGYNSCMFRVTSQLFGNTCDEFKRYLRVRYFCTANEPNIKCGINEVRAPCQDLCPNMCPEANVTHPVACSKLCKGPGCVCKEGCVRDRKSMMCIKKEYCAKPGGSNEEFSLCDADKQSMCPPAKVSPITTTMPPWTCTPGYVCKQGFVRDRFTGKCVPPIECPIID